ncbi:uncharacterized protein NFIA_113180 [Aspergillus fischeri NRRL 181]|uniref:4a-hydroxytetrahydrobiopterin dehydratase n=1 Tax=Neosartorya fischeri (strain ATCC 1020 / DSM 3700 / CBS 544.65 / FGSC A1164 / JCM 1740 / NRRL 181 / WB 181) TaxID=331117 RepID=A1D8S7_NEOFI|nr:uncharacterized protein NFIA_113180 [Aspergillus fischeri NRRL 181]EAW20788.1 hypothetical protein NFIA_113180 [Aspergillus fischeri NRRL 181]
MDQLYGIHFADGFDEKDGLPRLRKLLDSKWNISSDGKGIEKKFHFKNHTNVLDFVHYIGVKCKRKNHHPEAIMRTSLTKRADTEFLDLYVDHPQAARPIPEGFGNG